MTTEKGALAAYGVALSKSGYEVIHVGHAKKGPTYDGWQSIETNPEVVAKWAANGKANCNVGVRTRLTPAIDIDILDAEFSDQVAEWCQQNIGSAPVRVGRSPKQLLVYGASTSFRKKAISLVSPDGKTQKVEILGEGQQFIAYGIHEDTKKPYVWTSELELTDLETWELSDLTEASVEALFDFVAGLASIRGWSVKQRSGKSIEGKAGSIDDYQFGTDFTREELEKFLAVLDPDNGYDYWLQVGQALHHHYDGDHEGMELWDQWSSNSLDYNPTELSSKWKSFKTDRGGKVITAKTLALWAKEENKKHEAANFDEVLTAIAACTDILSITNGELPKELAKKINDPSQLEIVCQKIVAKSKELGTKIPVGDIRKSLKKAMKSSAGKRQLPWWCADYVYVLLNDKFYNTVTHQAISDRAFNAAFNRSLDNTGDDSLSATRIALDTFCIPCADSYTYMPGNHRLIERRGLTLVNTYNDAGVPQVPEVTTLEEDEAVERVQKHFELMFPDQRERELLISFFAYTAQNLDKRIRWAPLIHGGEGVGKTFYMEMMRGVLGLSNVMPLSARQLAQQFTSWAEGRKIVIFEEIRLSGQNRFEILDALKPYITNDTVDVRKMHTDSYVIESVTNYVLFTNHADALPLAVGDRRYFVLTTSLISRPEIIAFRKKNPNYFTELFDGMRDWPGAVLKWLLEYELHPEFNPNGDAPETDSKEMMRETSQDEAFDSLEDFLNAAPQWDVCNELLCLKSLEEFQNNLEAPDLDSSEHKPILRAVLPPPNRMRPLLTQLGFHAVGKARPGSAGPQGRDSFPQRYWSKTPEAVARAGGIQEFVRLKNPDYDDLGID